MQPRHAVCPIQRSADQGPGGVGGGRDHLLPGAPLVTLLPAPPAALTSSGTHSWGPSTEPPRDTRPPSAQPRSEKQRVALCWLPRPTPGPRRLTPDLARADSSPQQSWCNCRARFPSSRGHSTDDARGTEGEAGTVLTASMPTGRSPPSTAGPLIPPPWAAEDPAERTLTSPPTPGACRAVLRLLGKTSPLTARPPASSQPLRCPRAS